MELKEILENQRIHYINKLTLELKNKPEAVCELLVDLDKKYSEKLFRMWRFDCVEHVGDKNFTPTEFNSDTYFNHIPLKGQFNNIQVELNPFFWNGCEFLLSKEPSTWTPFHDWIKKWIDIDNTKEFEKSLLKNVIHNVTQPKSIDKKIFFAIDFGSASINSFLELLEIFQQMNIYEVTIGSELESKKTNRSKSAGINLNNIYPRIKETIKSDENQALGFQEKSIKLPPDQTPLLRFYSHNLYVGYIQDVGDRFEYLNNGVLNEDLTLEKIHNVALRNLERFLENKMNYKYFANQLLFIEADRNFNSSIVLLDFVWPQIEKLLNDTLIISIPNRSILLVCGEHSSKGLDNIRKYTKDIYIKHPNGRISIDLFKMKNGVLDFFESTI
jgi:uncharacterized protein YtpQ (UPF0354 family)